MSQEMTKPVGLDQKIAEAGCALMSGKPVILYGPSGTGKTIAGWEIAHTVAKELGNNVIYLQLYPEITKSTLIGGETIKNGNITIDVGPIIKLGGEETDNGAVFIIDECTHATEPALLAFNSLIEAPFQTVVGANVHRMHENTRFLFAGNTPDHAGNIAMPESFANRLYVVDFPVPEKDHLIAILDGTVAVKEDMKPLQDFIVDVAVKTRSHNFSVSPRNLINCIQMLTAAAGSGYQRHAGFNEVSKKLRSTVKKLDMNPSVARNVILATMLGNVVVKNDGPDKVKALLWEEK